MAGHFEEQIADQTIREKVRANDAATLLEANFAQDPANVAALYELLGCQQQPVPTFDRVIPYEVSDERGAALPLEQVLTDRLIPNILAAECGALQNRLRELASNTAARNGARRNLAHPMVSACQAAAAVVPQHLGQCWAFRETLKLLSATLAKPSTERLKALEDPAKTGLEVEAMKTEVGRVSGEAIAHSLTVAKTARSKTSAQVHQSLTETLARYDSSVRPGTEAKLTNLAQHYEEVAIPETLQRLVNSLIDRGATLTELVVTARGLERGLLDFADRVEKELEKASASLKAKRDDFNGLIRKLSGNPVLSGSLKEGAATALNDVIKADEVVLRHRAIRTLTRQMRQGVSNIVHELETTHRAAQKVGVAMKKRFVELRELATVQTTTYRSVIRPEEFDEAMKRLDAGIRAANESIPAINLKELIAGGDLGLHDQLDEFVEERVAIFNDYFEAHLTDVAGTVKSLRLAFSLEKWIDSTTRTLACSMAVRMSAAPHGAEPQTVIVGCGEDRESVMQVLRRRPTLNNVETIQGTDPRMMVIYRRFDGLTIQAIPSFTDALRAAEAFPKPGPGLTAWDNLGSAGHLLGAVDQEGLVPESWAHYDNADTGRAPDGEDAFHEWHAGLTEEAGAGRGKRPHPSSFLGVIHHGPFPRRRVPKAQGRV